MVPKPVGNNAQKQPLTTALKNICRDYPAGGGVLRELLQNADDAGATLVRFHLDERTHPTNELIHSELAKYQGPALLAYNNAIFTQKDFESLASLGDSLKLQDGLKTGKFGRGFNSVYNWTDSPAIVSLDRLLILDPHEEWSEGGPLYDFVAEAEDRAVQNHMAAFQSVMDNLAEPFDGTIIRIPLRSRERATESKISSRETTVLGVREVLEKFAAEFGDSGLLFLRNIGEIIIDSTSGISISISVEDLEGIKKHKLIVNNALKLAVNDSGYTFDHSFEMKILRKSGQELKKTCFAVHHTICGHSMKIELEEWAKAQSLLPWVAVAAQFPRNENFQGSLFTVLPLPISINQPVRVHGLFSLSPDRARLYQLKEDSTQDQSDAKWNEWLLRNPVPMAWTKLLSHLADLHPDESTFQWWPRNTDGNDEILSDALDRFVEIVANESLPLWSTSVGHVTLSKGLLNVGEKSTSLREALKEAHVPVIYVPDRLHSSVEHLFNGRILDPHRLCIYLMNKQQIEDWSLSAKQAILEYVLSDPGFTDYGSLELFPFKDGKYRAIAKHTAFVYRNESEMELFEFQNDHNIDLGKVSKHTSNILKSRCTKSAATLHPSIRHCSEQDFRDYCLNFYFPQIPAEQDSISLDASAAAFVSKAWLWILEQRIAISGVISDLWLLPMTNGCHRKVRPCHSNSETFFAPLGSMGDLMRAFDGRCSSSTKPLLDTRPSGLSIQAQEGLLTASRTYSNLLIRDGGNVTDFVKWLRHLHTVVNSASDKEKNKLVEVIAWNLPIPLSPSDGQAIGDAIGDLEIFKKVSRKMEDDKGSLALEWTSAKATMLSINLPGDVIAVPPIANVQFLHAPWTSNSSKLLNNLKLATYLTPVEVIDRYIIPSWISPQTAASPYSCNLQSAKLVFSHYSSLSSTSRAKLRSLRIIPVSRLNGEIASKFAAATDLIDPCSGLNDLFFGDEEVVPESGFCKDFHASLIDIGLKCAVDETLVFNRVRYYASSNHSVPEIQQRAHKLLRFPCRWDSPESSSKGSELRQLKWLPVLDHSGILGLRSPKECRSSGDILLVGPQMPIFRIYVSTEWKTRLGWRDSLPKHVLLEQLNQGLRIKERAIIDAILTYIVKQGEIQLYINDLESLPCVLIGNNLYVTASKAFQPTGAGGGGCERLEPYLGNVDSKFWQDHQLLLGKLKIRESPFPDELFDVIRVLESQRPLNDSDVNIAIAVLDLATRFPRASLAGLKVLTQAGEFCSIEEINFNDLGLLTPTEKVNLTHPSITRTMAKRLGIEFLSQRLMKGKLEIADIDDEDEFEQHEQITTRILDTLDRYPIDNTFREYLANADDTTGTSEVNWFLDERTHPDLKLLTPELKPLQGPALLVHNDGVFSDSDFKGFKNVGEGSKGQNKETIGQFGRGSQTMYHWTDVPMILSGKYLLILDPQQQVLPRNRITGKQKPGVKVELSKLKNTCPDQLAPFEGLYGYYRDLDNYSGTIFRFPLRNKGTESKLRTREVDLDARIARQKLTSYFEEARISLLFLKRITSMDFKVQGGNGCEWSVHKDPTDPNIFSQWANCSFTKSAGSGAQITGKDKWFIAVEDLRPQADLLPYSPRRVMKNIECGIAGLVPSVPVCDSAIPWTPPKAIKPCIFNMLPLPLLSDLPVCVHASFSLSGDRQSLIIDDHGSESDGSKWNRFLLGTALPQLYLSFLDDIGSHVRNDVLKFWPQEDPPKRSNSELLCSSFWNELPKSSGRLFPKAQPISIKNQRHAPALFDIHQATFDFLPKTRSDMLAPLMLSLNVKLVQQVPIFIAKHLKELPEVHKATGQMLRGLLKSETSRMHLQNEISRNPQIIGHLLALVLPAGENLEDLDGCHILPLTDGTVATLRLQSPTAPHVNYFFASKQEQDLFRFASRLLISPIAGNLFDQVISCGKFNLEKLQIHNVGRLLAIRPLPASVNTATDEWLTAFWRYWNEASTSSSESVNYDFPRVFRASLQGGNCYLSLSDLNSLPAVVEPFTAEHKLLCGKFSGLWRFKSEFMPDSLGLTETSFDNGASFFRFIKSLKALAVQNGITLGGFIKKNLSIEDLKILRGLIGHYASHEITPTMDESQRFKTIKADLRSIPLWPSVDPTCKELISAEDALIVTSSGCLVPWMQKYSQFVDPGLARDKRNKNCIQLLDIQTVSTISLLKNHVLPLPLMSSAGYWSSYQLFISTVSSLSESEDNLHEIRTALSKRLVAVNGDRSLRKVDELYDHKDPTFISAFRGHEASRFLHTKVQAFHRFWLKVGLRSPKYGVFDPEDYVQCLKSLSQRLRGVSINSDPTLVADTQTVLSPLINPNSSSQKFGFSDWSTISREKVFPALSNFNNEPEHRRIPMVVVATDRPVLALSQIISNSYIAICWSQTSFALHAPTTEALSFTHGKGKPSVEMVWRHLNYLADMAQHLQKGNVKDFLHDLHCTYLYLQEHAEESRAYFNLSKKAIWLNILPAEAQPARLSDVQSSWNEIGDLVLSSSCDAGRVKAVRPSLMRYERLLRALGCKSIIYPTIASPTLHQGHSISVSLRSLRAKNKLLDITFCTEGKELRAHRVVLAAVSEKWARQWSSLFPVEDRITFDPADPDCFLSYHTLSTMIDYAYETEIDWSGMEASDDDDGETREEKLQLLLDLHMGAQFWMIPALMSQVEAKILPAGKLFINIENVVATRERAEYVGAKAVEEMCAQFIRKNLDAVNRANGSVQ